MNTCSQPFAELLKVNKSKVGLLVFLLIYPLDTIFHILGEYVGYNIPVGMAGISLSFLLLPFFLLEKNGNLVFGLTFSSLVFLMCIGAFFSGRFRYIDVYFWARVLAFFASGCFFYYWLESIGSEKRSKYFLFFVLLALVIALFTLTFSIDGLNYLRLSEGFLLTAFIVLALSKSGKRWFLVFVVSLVALYFLESRFSFLIFIVCCFAVSFLESKTTYKVVHLSLWALVFLFLYWAGYYFYRHLGSVHDNRFLRLVFSVDQDTSLISRDFLLINALQVFSDNFLLGDYKYYLDYGSEGAYAHNFISYWAEFGVIGIMFSIFLFVTILSASVKAVRMLSKDVVISRLVLYISLTLLIGLLFVKSYNWSFLYYGVGFLSAFLFKKGSIRGFG